MNPAAYIFVVTLLSIPCVIEGLNLNSNSKDYNGYQVLRVFVGTEDELNTIENIPRVDFWTDPAVEEWCDIMVSPSDLSDVIHLLGNKNFSWRVFIPDVGRIIEEQEVSIARERNLRTLGFWDEYQTLDAIYSWIYSTRALYPDIVSTHTIGHSFELRPMRLLKISKGDGTRPAVFLDSGIHAREWISPAVLTYVLDQLLSDPQYADILEGVDIHALPVLNPDGYYFTHTRDRMWRKNRRPDPSGVDCFGIDLNRNFPYEWCTVGASNDSCSLNYCGSSPGSEIETSVVTEYVQRDIDWWGFVTLHSYGEEWCIPWAHTAEHAPDYDDMWAVGQKAVDALQAVNGFNFTLKIPSGRYGGFSMDWAKGVRKIKYPVLIELRDTGEYGFILPPDQIISSGEEILAAIAVYLREIIAEFERENPTIATTLPPSTINPSTVAYSKACANFHIDTKLLALVASMLFGLSLRDTY